MENIGEAVAGNGKNSADSRKDEAVQDEIGDESCSRIQFVLSILRISCWTDRSVSNETGLNRTQN